MERKKEKIMLLSLQRRQQQEEAKARKEIEAMKRKEEEQEKEEEKLRKKEEQMARRAIILEQHRLKKAIEEAEREGKTLDRHTAEMLMKQQQHQQHQQAPQPRMRTNKVTRPRPKTIHVETNAAMDLGSGTGKKGSSSNLTGNFRGNFSRFFAFSSLYVAFNFFFPADLSLIFVFLFNRHYFNYQLFRHRSILKHKHNASRLLSRQFRLVIDKR